MSKCMGLLGGLWTPELIWALSDGPRRFSEIQRSNAFISAKVLTTRLRDLEKRGVLTRSVMPTSPPTVEYALTPLGQDLLPAIRSIVEVGTRLLLRDASAVSQDLAIEAAADIIAPQQVHDSSAKTAPDHFKGRIRETGTQRQDLLTRLL
jgi:DNA-binding HxlR family transcriptional regulator